MIRGHLKSRIRGHFIPRLTQLTVNGNNQLASVALSIDENGDGNPETIIPFDEIDNGMDVYLPVVIK